MKKLIGLVCALGIMLSSGLSFGAGNFSWPMFVAPTTGVGSNQFLTKTLAGNWTFNYTIGSSPYVNYYYLDINDVREDPTGSNEYWIHGEDQYANPIFAGYDPNYDDYTLFDPGSIIDLFFTFIYTNSNTVAGWYSLYSHSSGSWSDLYPMSGVRTATSKSLNLVKNTDMSIEGEQQLIKKIEAAKQGNNQLTDKATLKRLKSLRDRLIAE